MARYIECEDAFTEIDKGDLLVGNNAEWAKEIVRRTPTADVVPKSEVERLENEIKALLAFKDYFSDLYGHSLEVANWHENGKLEPFDNFYESAEDEYEAELKKKYTEGL